jgi:hypothetical protein
MKWTIRAAVLFCFVLYPHAAGPTLAQQRTQPGAPEQAPKVQAASQWEVAEAGVDVIRHWKIMPPAPGEPETATLRLSEEKYNELRKDARVFFNRLNIFSKPVRSAKKTKVWKFRTPARRDEPSAVKGDDPAVVWYVSATHWPTSDSDYSSYRGGG